MSQLLQQLNEELATLVERVRESLVQIHSGRRGAGAGTIWHPDGLIITNAHVVRHNQLHVALPDGRTLPARVLARDDRRDVAALSIDAHDLSPIALGDSRRLLPGEWVLALGHPWGVHGAVTAGSIIGVGPAALPEWAPSERDWIAVSLHLRPGHSGGPLVDSAGRLVGINTMMNGPDVGIAVPVHTVKHFLRRSLDRASPLRQATVTV